MDGNEFTILLRCPTNPDAGISKDAGNVKSPLLGERVWVRASVKVPN
jgi:hypothetical protein